MRKWLKGGIGILSISFLAGLAFSRGSFAHQARVSTVHQVVIVDSTGKTVGAALGGVSLVTLNSVRGTQLNPTVLLKVDQRLVAVNIERNRFFGGTVYFEAENCAGSAWFAVPPRNGRPSLLPQAAVGPPGQTLYAETLGAGPQTVTLRSKVEDDAFCLGPFFFGPITVTAVPAQPLVDLLTVFTPPFSLRAVP